MGGNREKESNDPFTLWMNSWFDYVNACNSMYTEYIRNITRMTESWFNSFSKFGQYNIRISKSGIGNGATM